MRNSERMAIGATLSAIVAYVAGLLIDRAWNSLAALCATIALAMFGLYLSWLWAERS